MFTWPQILLAVLKLVNTIMGAVNQAIWKKAGRDEVTSKVNAETLDTQNKMDNVPRPSDDDVSRSMQSGKF